MHSKFSPQRRTSSNNPSSPRSRRNSYSGAQINPTPHTHPPPSHRRNSVAIVENVPSKNSSAPILILPSSSIKQFSIMSSNNMSRNSHNSQTNHVSFTELQKPTNPPMEHVDDTAQVHPGPEFSAGGGVPGGAGFFSIGSSPGAQNSLNVRQVRTNKLTLSFLEQSVESEYELFFLLRNKISWRRSLALILLIEAVVFVSTLVKFHPSVSTECNAMDMNSTCLQTTPQSAPFCSSGFGDVDCVVVDSLFWIIGLMLPVVLLYVVSLWLSDRRLSKYIQYFTAIISVVGSLLGFGVRQFYFGRLDFFYVNAVGFLLFLYSVHIMLRARLVIAIVSLSLSIFAYLLLVGLSFLALENSQGAFGVIVVVLVAGAIAISYSCYETEVFYRAQFLTLQQLMKTNAKLTQQLKVLQKGYTSRAADFESPLEKSLMVVKSMQADSTINANHLSTLAYLMQLLTSPNLLTPDLEGIAEGAAMDNEQEAWFFSEIASRRKKQTKGSDRRASISNAFKVGTPVQHSTDISQDVGTPPQITPTPNQNNSNRHLSNASEILTTSQVDDGLHPPNIKNLLPYSYWCDDSPVAYYLSRVNEYNFPIFDFAKVSDDHPLICLGYFLFKRANLFTTFDIAEDVFLKFITEIEMGYRQDNPFHNRMHAADVLHAASHFVDCEVISKHISDLELMGVYIACACHDFDHPGVTNNFLINTGDRKAIIYNDRAVLENHHLSSAFTVLSKPNHNFLSNITTENYKMLRNLVIEMVLATDLSQHFNLLAMFKNKLAGSESFEPVVQEDRILLWKVTMKCADVNNPTKEWSLSEKWVERVISEFFCQGDQEKRLNLKVSPYMNRDDCSIPSCQIGFIEYVVGPLFEAYDKYIKLGYSIENLQKNKDRWIFEKEMAMVQMGSTN